MTQTATLSAEIVRQLPYRGTESEREKLLKREWIVTNGLGGYSSGTVSGVITRRYHGILIAALPAHFGRMVMLTDLAERLIMPEGQSAQLGGEERAESLLRLHGEVFLREFRLERGLPVWRYEVHGRIVEKKLMMLQGQNTVYLTYRLLSGEGPVRLELRPAMNFRQHEAPVNTFLPSTYRLTAEEDHYEFSVARDLPRLRMRIYGDHAAFTFERRVIREIIYRTEESRGYEARGDLWSPGYFRVYLVPGRDATIVASTEGWETIEAFTPEDAANLDNERRLNLLADAHPKAREGLAAELVLAADQFIITPPGRREDLARARAVGEQARTVIAGYHWFTDWGRDTMISLEGLTLMTGRFLEAGWILRTFSNYIQDGLIPNMFPEGQKRGLYHTADATLWFFHAVERYVAITKDAGILDLMIPRFLEIVEHHLEGTEFGIGVDPADGLLRQGKEGYQLTWMDAKAGDWVVTPRRGKAVEINALWYNALRLLEGWVRAKGDDAAAGRLAAHAARAKESFNRRFWYEEEGYLYDLVDGEMGSDPACRPNQLLSISLDYPVLDQSRWAQVIGTVQSRLLTPVGLRSLAPGHPDYKPRYYGDLRTRDAAYHQGTVWAWLIGPFVDAWLKLHPGDRAGARRFLEGFNEHMDEGGVGTISEIFDADEPFHSRGCIAQAWSVAEVLRCLVKTAE